MTRQELATEIAQIPIEQIADFVDEIYDALALANTPENLALIADKLSEAGVEVDGLCRKKHPVT